MSFEARRRKAKETIIEKIKAAINTTDDEQFLEAAVGATTEALKFFWYRVTERPIPFAIFLQKTGEYFDGIIYNRCEHEGAQYAGGKIVIELIAEETMSLEATLYFLTPEQEWTVESCIGELTADGIIDWEVNEDLILLRNEHRIEFPIDPPAC